MNSPLPALEADMVRRDRLSALHVSTRGGTRVSRAT